MTRACLAALFALGTCPAWAQSVKIERVEAAQFPEITVPMRFSGATMARTPARADLLLTEDGKPVGDFELAVDPEPLVISLVVDQSGSMIPAMDALKRAARAFIDELPSGARVEVLAFSDRVVRLEGFTSERRALRGAIEKLQPHGPTLLYDSILAGLEDLPGGGEGRRILIAFTDGRDQNAAGTAPQSRSSARDVVDRARKDGIPLYLVGLGAEVQQKLLSRMAAVTGGQYFHAPSPDQLAAIYRDVARLLSASFRATYRTPRPEPDGTRRAVELVSTAKEFPGRAKGSYVAPATRPSPSPRPARSIQAPATPSPVASARPRPPLHPIPPGAADPFALGLFGADSVTLAGNGTIDSYDSRRGPYEAQAKTKALSSRGDVGSNGNVEMTGNGMISGAVLAGGTLRMANNSTIEGKVTAGGQVTMEGNSVIEGGLMTNADVSTTDNAEVKGESSTAAQAAIPQHRLPPVDLSAVSASNDDEAIDPSQVTPGSPPSFSAGGLDEVTIPSGVYLFRSFTVQDSAKVKLAGPVMIFVTEELRLEGAGLASALKRPQDLVIYYTGTAPATCGGTGEFHGGIYAPSAPIEIVGEPGYFGGAVGKSLTVSGNGSIHLDRDLSAIMTAPGKTPPRTTK